MTVLLTITTTHAPATDLGFLLHKHPGRVQSFPQSVGTAHVFYPEATAERCTAALLLEVDPVGAGPRPQRPAGEGFALGQYVNDRPYAASSMLAMALKDVFRTALTGRCDARPELAAAAIPLEISRARAALPRRRGPAAPAVRAARLAGRGGRRSRWTRQFPDWGDSRYLGVRLTGDPAAGRRAEPPVRAAAGAGRRQALLGQQRRGRQADPGRRWLAGRAPGEGR